MVRVQIACINSNSKSFEIAVIVLCLMAEGHSDSSLSLGSSCTLNKPMKQLPSPLCLEVFLPQDSVGRWGVLPELQRSRRHCAMAGVRAHQKLVRVLDAAPPHLRSESSFFSCSILDKVSRTPLTPPPPCTSKIVPSLLPGDPLILHTWSRAGKDLMYFPVLYYVRAGLIL